MFTYGSKLLILCIFGVALSHESLIGLIYLVTLLFTLLIGRGANWRGIWSPFYLISVFFMVCVYTY